IFLTEVRVKNSLALSLLALVAVTAPLAAKGTPPAAKPKTAEATGKADKGKKDEPKDVLSADTFSGLKLREVGPALTSGRITDIAVDPHDKSVRYVASASGGVWKSSNAGLSWSPVFDGQGSYSIGCVAVDPSN